VFEIEVEGTFEQSPDHVFDYLADFRNMPGWNQNVLSMEKTSPGPVSVSTTFSSKVQESRTHRFGVRLLREANALLGRGQSARDGEQS